MYVLDGQLGDDELAAIKKYVINPVETREAGLETRETLATYAPTPQPVEVLDGFREMDDAQLTEFIADRGLAMDEADLRFVREYFQASNEIPPSPRSR